MLSPLIGLAVGLILTVAIQWMFHGVRNVDALNKGFRRGQLVSAAAFSLGHGANDAQKTMGIILALLIAAGTCRPTPTCRSGWCSPPTPPSASARSPAGGGS